MIFSVTISCGYRDINVVLEASGEEHACWKAYRYALEYNLLPDVIVCGSTVVFSDKVSAEWTRRIRGDIEESHE